MTIQTAIVTFVALGALLTIARRVFATKLPAAFRPSRKPPACDGCALTQNKAQGTRHHL
jgi:hypothetical protein